MNEPVDVWGYGEKPLALGLDEAVALVYYIPCMEEWRHFRIKLIDAVLQIEDGVAAPFSICLRRDEAWFIDANINEVTKDLKGNSLKPLLRRVWRLLVEWYADDLLHVPELPRATDGDRTYKEARSGRDNDPDEDDPYNYAHPAI